jgi:hypothetical protein
MPDGTDRSESAVKVPVIAQNDAPRRALPWRRVAAAGPEGGAASEEAGTPEEPTGAAIASGPAARALFPSLTAAAVAVLMVVHGQLPFLISSVERWFTAVGAMECGALSLRSLADASCHLVGGPGGGQISNGIAFVAPGSVLIRALGVSPASAYVIVALAFMAVAFFGTFGLGRRLGLQRWPAFGAAFVYLASPSLIGMNGLGSSFWGMALVPTAVLAALSLGRAFVDGVSLSRERASVTWRAGGAALLWVACTVFMLLLDGYGFVMAQSIVALAIVWEIIKKPRSARSWSGAVAFVFVLVLSFASYKSIIPGAGEWTPSSIDLFRSMGADLVTLVVPSESQWWASSAPWAIDPSVMWGDGTNSRYNYLGVVSILLAAGVVLRNRGRRSTGLLLALALITAVLALGPSLKILDVRGALQIPVTYESYLMPAEDAVASLPTTWLFENVPGLDSMRATYRWIGVTRLAIIFLAALGIQQLLVAARGTGRKAAVVLLCVVALLEVAIDLPSRLTVYRDHAATVSAISEDVVEPMAQAVPEGSLVVIAPSIGGHTNQYLANYLAPALRSVLYNIGGDKAVEAAIPLWPDNVRTLITAEDDFAEAAEAVLIGGEAHLVVIPFFDLRWSLSRWPTIDEFAEPGRDALDDVLGDPSLHAEVYEYFAVVTLAP